MMVLLGLLIALSLLCFALGMVFILYMCTLWTSSTLRGGRERGAAQHGKAGKGLSTAELERLGGAADGGVVAGEECAVCLEDIEEGQLVRVMPECRHAFHRPCSDRWLSSNAECPLCRAHLSPPTSTAQAQAPPPLPPLPQTPQLSPPVPLHVVLCA